MTLIPFLIPSFIGFLLCSYTFPLNPLNSHQYFNQASTSNYLSQSIIKHSKSPDWTSFGPLRLDVSKIGIKGRNLIYQGYNSSYKPIYVAIDCEKKLINVTNKNLVWKGWFKVERGFELNMLKHLCKKTEAKF